MHCHEVHRVGLDMLTQTEMAILNNILDQLIPANKKRELPSAGKLEVAAFIVQRAIKNPALKKDIASIVRYAQSKADKVSPSFVRQLQENKPSEFESLLTETYKGYYSRPDIREKLGLSAHAVHPQGYDVRKESEEFLDALTEPVRRRGPIFLDPTKGRKDEA
jgi:hypothetical protein